MSARAWAVILTAWASLDERVSRDIPAKMAGPDASATLVKLREDLAARLLTLTTDLEHLDVVDARKHLSLPPTRFEEALTEPPTPDPAAASAAPTPIESQSDPMQILAALSIYLDERVLRRLASNRMLEWRHLQREVIHSSEGGDLFYRIVDRLIASPRTSSLVLEVYDFCLRDGFLGRFAHEPGKIEEYERRLAARIPPPPEPPAPLRPPTPDAPHVRSPIVYYAITAAIVVLLPFLAKLLSNL